MATSATTAGRSSGTAIPSIRTTAAGRLAGRSAAVAYSGTQAVPFRADGPAGTSTTSSVEASVRCRCAGPAGGSAANSATVSERGGAFAVSAARWVPQAMAAETPAPAVSAPPTTR